MSGQEKERDEEIESDELKVTDRRQFTSDGQLRDGVDEDESEPETHAESPEAPPSEDEDPGEPDPQSFDRRPVEEPQGVDFTMLINYMAQPAFLFLGEIPNPETGQPEIDLDRARMQIDLLDLLRVRCRGNLSPEEESWFDRLLYELRMRYVARSSQPGQ